MSTVSQIRNSRKESHKPSFGQNPPEYPVFVQHNGRRQMVGGIIQRADGSRLLRKTISFKQHLLRVPSAIGWSVTAIAEARVQHCQAIRVINRDDNSRWDVSFDCFMDFSFDVKRNGRQDPQRALGLVHWSCNGEPSEWDKLTAVRVAIKVPATPMQPSLFEVQE